MKPLEFVRSWIDRHLAHEEALLLLVLLSGGLLLVIWLGGTLAPALTALVFAFILQGVVARLRSWGLGAQPAVWAAYGLFVTLVVVLLFFVLPLIGRQLYGFVEALPAILDQVRVFARGLPERYPTLLTQAQIDMGLEGVREEIVAAGQLVVEWLFSRLGSLVSLIIYLVLVPILVFFFLKDKGRLLGWAQSFLPSERPMLDQVGAEMNLQIANYVRGKALEILIVGCAAFATFWAFDLNYAALLAVLVGFSVLIPFVGATLATFPVALVAFGQFGWGLDFGWVLLAYGVLQALDGNVLVPLLFSEAVDLHPVAIIIAVLAFGGIWGFWGVFFAIPLASLIKAVINAWPTAPAEPA